MSTGSSSNMDLKKLKHPRTSNKTRYEIVKSYFEKNNEINLNTEVIGAELEAFPIVKYLQSALKDEKFVTSLDDGELLKMIQFQERLINIQQEPSEISTSESISVQDLTNNQIKNHLSVKFDTSKESPSTWFSVEHLKIYHVIIVKIPGLKNNLEEKIGDKTVDLVERLLEETVEDIGSAEEIVTGFDSAKIKCSNIAERTKIFNFIKKIQPEWDVTIPSLLNPHVKLLDVKFDNEKVDEWIERLYQKNRWKKCWKFEVKHHYRSGKFFDVVAEIDPALREWFEEKNGLISIGYKRAKVIDYFDIKQCKRCTRFGHLANRCSLMSICAFCGEKAHGKDNCEFKEQRNKWKCPNCLKPGENAWETKCSKFQERLIIELERRNFQYKVIMA